MTAVGVEGGLEEEGREREVGERRACAWRLGSSLVNVLITFPLHSQPASLFSFSLLPSSTAPPPPLLSVIYAH